MILRLKQYVCGIVGHRWTPDGIERAYGWLDVAWEHCTRCGRTAASLYSVASRP